MADLEGLLKAIRAYNKEKEERSKTYAGSLVDRMAYKNAKTNEEYLALEQEVAEFFKSNASEEDKQYVASYAESMRMICNAIREGRL